MILYAHYTDVPNKSILKMYTERDLGPLFVHPINPTGISVVSVSVSPASHSFYLISTTTVLSQHMTSPGLSDSMFVGHKFGTADLALILASRR